MAVPKKPLPEGFNPFPAAAPSSFVYDLSALHTYDGNLIAGMSSVMLAREKARFLMPQEIANFQAWATAHPTVDPRTWTPLARAGMHPDSAPAQQVAQTDIARQIQDGTYGQAIGAPHSPPTGPSNNPPGRGTFGWLNSLGSEANSTWNDVYNATKGTTRVALTAAAAPLEAGTALFRQIGGASSQQEEITKEYGLSPAEAGAAFRPTDQLDKPMQGTIPVGGRAGGGGAFHVQALSEFDSDAQDRIRKANQAWMTTGGRENGQNPFTAPLASIAQQTELGQLVEHPELATKTIDPKTGKPIAQTSWLPSKEGQALAEQQALKVFDITTAAERARGIAPTAWTPGRGLAHIWYDPNSTAFNAMSGTADAGVSIFGDPVNLIGVGAAGKVAEGVRVVSKGTARAVGFDVAPTVRQAMRAGQEQVVVATPTARFMPGGAPGGSPLAGAREGARAKDAVAAARAAGVQRIIEPSLKVDEETGRVVGPHGHFLMGQQAWDWLNRGRGARVVDYLSKETNSHKIWLASGRKMDSDLAVQLSNAATPEEVRSILGTRIGYDVRDPSELGMIGSRAPALFKNRALLDSGGLFTSAGRTATVNNARRVYEMNLPEDAGAIRKATTRVGAGVTAATSFGVGMFRQAPSVRTLDLEDADVAMSQLDAFLRGTRVDTETAAKHIDAIVKAPNGAARYALIYGPNGVLNTAVRKTLIDQGLEEKHANAITRAFEGGLSGFQRDWINDSIPDGYAARPGNVGRALLETEQLSRAAVLPDYRTLRRASGGIGRIIQATPGDTFEAANRVSDFLQGATSAWRYSVLLRPAYVLRELGELAFASSLGGYDGLFSHPAAFIANVHQTALSKHIMDTDHRLANAMTGAPLRRAQVWLHEGLARLHPSLDPDVARLNGQKFWDEANKVIDGNSHEGVASMFDGLSSIHGNFQIDEAGSRVSAKAARSLVRGDQDTRDAYIAAFVDKLHRAHGDRDMRNIANPDMSKAATHQAFIDGTYELKRTMRPDLLTGSRKSQQKYLDGYRDLLQKITLGDEDLMNAVLTGKYADKDLLIQTVGKRNAIVSKELRDKIGTLLDNPEMSAQMPDVLHDFGSTYTKRRWGQQFTNEFFASTGEWSDLFARGPLIRQAYTKRVLELAPDLSPAARADAIANLRNAGDTKLARMVADAPKNPHGTLGIDEVDHIASGFARKESERVFYDAHKRQNYALAMRTVMPFAQATFNTFRRWGEMSLRNPQMMYRATKPLEALMDPGSAAIYGELANVPGGSGLRAFYTPNHPELSADGFFFTNSYGDRQYAFPLLGPLGALMPGASTAVGMGSVSGLNVAGTSLFPGAGPMLTLGESLVVPDRIYQDDHAGAVLRFMNPYGLPKGSIPDKIWGTISANWARRLAQVSDPSQSANGTMKALPGLLSSGEYDRTSPSDMRRAVSDAKGLSDFVSVLSAFGVAVTPGSFTPEFLTSVKGDKTGDVRRMMITDKLAQEYQKYIKPLPGVDPQVARDQGTAQFIKDFGDTALFAVMPRTQVDGPQATNDIWHFRSQNPGAYTSNQPIIGLFFAGGDISGEMSQNLYRWQQATGERKPKDPQQYVADVNQTLGWLAWNAKQKDIDSLPDDQQAVGRALVRADIEKTYPGWTGKASDLGKFDRRYNEVKDALKDPAVASLASADYIDTYINTREQALADLEHRFGVTDLASKTAINAGISAQLISLAHRLRQQDTSGGFTNAWSRLFSQEFPGVESSG